jgi:hypothetical protein
MARLHQAERARLHRGDDLRFAPGKPAADLGGGKVWLYQHDNVGCRPCVFACGFERNIFHERLLCVTRPSAASLGNCLLMKRKKTARHFQKVFWITLGGVAPPTRLYRGGEVRKQADQSDEDQVDGDQIVEQPRQDQNQDSEQERDQGLNGDDVYMHGRPFVPDVLHQRACPPPGRMKVFARSVDTKQGC